MGTAGRWSGVWPAVAAGGFGVDGPRYSTAGLSCDVSSCAELAVNVLDGSGTGLMTAALVGLESDSMPSKLGRAAAGLRERARMKSELGHTFPLGEIIT